MSFFRIITTGPWKVFSSVWGGIALSFAKVVDKETARFVDNVHGYLTNGVRTGGFSPAANTTGYERVKELSLGGGGILRKPPLVRTGKYVASIKVIKDRDGFRISPTGNSAEGVPYEAIGLWLEFGTKRMVARPHWRPAAQWASQRLPTVGRAVINGLRFPR